MANTKLEETKTLLETYQEKVASSPEAWLKFLATASNNHKYSFPSQILIYAQRPQATACANFNVWSKQVGRKIKKGSKGIPVLVTDKGGSEKLEHLFDIQDTIAHENSKPVKRWRMEESMQDFVLEELRKEHLPMLDRELGSGMMSEFGQKFGGGLMEVCIELCQNHCEETLEDLCQSVESSLLEDMSEVDIEMTYKGLVTSSVTFAVLSRCGLEPNKYLVPEEFEGIELFNTPETLSYLGYATSTIAKNLLQEVGEHTLTIEKKMMENKKTLDNSENLLYDNIGENSTKIEQPETNNKNKEETNDEREQNIIRATGGDILRGRGRNAVSQPQHEGLDGAEGGTSPKTDRVRTATEGLSQEPQGGDLPSDDGQRKSVVAPQPHRGTGGKDGATVDFPDDEDRRTDRGEPSHRSQVGGQTQHDQVPSTGDGASGSGVQLNPENTTHEQFTLFSTNTQPKEAEVQPSASYSMPQSKPKEHHEPPPPKEEKLPDFNPKMEEPSIDLSQEVAHTEEPIHLASDPFLPDLDEETIQSLHEQHDTPEPQAEQPSPEQQTEQPTSPKGENFKITNNNLGHGTKGEKLSANLTAIRTLLSIEEEQRTATPEEQEILSNYVGWGGLQEVFEEKHSLYQELKSLLSESEYQSARASVLDSHYTSPEIIQAMYDGLETMGLPSKVKILEPSLGVGNFLGAMTPHFEQATISGTELDDVSGRIAKQLYPNAKIEIQSFEHTRHRDNSFDLAIGNVPFGETKIFDPNQSKNLHIHDYFFAKTLDKVKTGGIVAVITSKGTMDKKDHRVRKYLSQRADLLGVIRLPNTAFRSNAGTEVTSDIIFLQKRETPPETTPDWVNIGESLSGINMNQYFIDHPEMVMGTMDMVTGRFGMESTCQPNTETPLKEQLSIAMQYLQKPDLELLNRQEQVYEELPDVPENARKHSFVQIDGEVYFNRNHTLERCKLKPTEKVRVLAMIDMVEHTRAVIDCQTKGCSDEELQEKQLALLQAYEKFYEKHGVFANRNNKSAFRNDSSYPLLRSLETLDTDKNLIGLADIFYDRTIKLTSKITSVDTPVEALAVSLSEQAMVDIPYMAELLGGSDKIQEIIDSLKGVIYKEPTSDLADTLTGWKTADEYLSGNVRKKLEIAREYAADHPELAINVEMLERVQPKQLEASEISVRIGATWIPPEIYKEFMFHLFEPTIRIKDHLDIELSQISGQWGIRGKNLDKGSPLVNSVYGSKRKSGYEILENALNLKDSKVYDIVTQGDKKVSIYNKKESDIVENCQRQITEKFNDWLWNSPERREKLAKIYNDTYNSVRPREFDGSHIKFEGMTDKIELKDHQVNAVARTLYGGNSLLAHCVGAGKTFTMIASAMEGKRLGLHNKSMILVPNHLTTQVGADVYKLYPSANVLVANAEDFSKERRQELCSRIATGNYDIIVMGHSQFTKIPLSPERVKETINEQVEEITLAIQEEKRNSGQSFTIKNLEKKKKELKNSLKKLVNEKIKDDVVHFEDLGVDKLYVDEAHKFKNLFLATKMSNVSGISSAYAQKSTDMLTKCHYLDEVTGGKGVVFATGTPVSNSMSELYTMMTYLQKDTLKNMNLQHFDSWASCFCEKVTDPQLSPTGAYKEKTRFSKFFNIPEIIKIWKECADIQTEDMLDLPTPEFEYEVVVNEVSDFQKRYINELSERADDVAQKLVDKDVDSMGIITMDGRKIALDQRLEDERLPDEMGSKVNTCIEKVADIWKETTPNMSAQLIFLDQSVPHFDGIFNLYDDIRDKLVERGVPKEQIAFIHEANKDEEKEALFAQVRSGEVRVLIGSTEKMGAGTNCQKKLIALHHLDIPWRPSDIAQREGRILRQGNENPKVKIFKYVTKATFDSYSWSVMENKQIFIGQVFTSKTPARSMDDIDAVALSHAETKAIATGDERIKEKMELDIDISKLKVLRSHHANTCHTLEDKTLQYYPQKIAQTEGFIVALERDRADLERFPPPTTENFRIEVNGVVHNERAKAGESLMQCCKELKSQKGTEGTVSRPIGEFRGFAMTLTTSDFGHFSVELKREGLTHQVQLEDSPVGNITRICNELERIDPKIEGQTAVLERLQKELASAVVECKKPFPREQEYQDKSVRLNELNKVLGESKKGRTPEEIELRKMAQSDRLSNKEIKKARISDQRTQFKANKKSNRDSR